MKKMLVGLFSRRSKSEKKLHQPSAVVGAPRIAAKSLPAAPPKPRMDSQAQPAKRRSTLRRGDVLGLVALMVDLRKKRRRGHRIVAMPMAGTWNGTVYSPVGDVVAHDIKGATAGDVLARAKKIIDDRIASMAE